ncbi:MAG: aminoglycoside 6-adenylyltransferase [Clostridiales bacterium]|nr:aminoglycoside 6-adenylyltransferase [Clostridiales bacterium]
MKSETQIYKIILNMANNDERIRAVELNGSRSNPKAIKDDYQDYDIACYVTDLTYYKNNQKFIENFMSNFGKLIIMQSAAEQSDYDMDNDNWYIYMMQFDDGIRIDLSFYKINESIDSNRESLSVILLDKDGLFSHSHVSDERDFYPKIPTDKEFRFSTNEFWWLVTYVAKGIARKEVTFSKVMFDCYLRKELFKMINWYIGITTDYDENPGKLGKNYHTLLDEKNYKLYLATYSSNDFLEMTKSLLTICKLYENLSNEVAIKNKFKYKKSEAQNVTKYILNMKKLGKI